METIGILSLLPPLLAIILAMATKQVLVSLFVAVWVGATLVNNYNPITGLYSAFADYTFNALGNPDNAAVIIMVVFCGSFSYLLETGGGARVFADTLARKIKGPKGAQVMAALGGTIIFFSDSTNPVLIGPVFKPLTDKMKVSREKLAYIVDATSATMPSMFFFTSWGAYILSIMNQQFESIGMDVNGIVMFNRSIPFMFYTVGAVILVYFIAVTGFDFGPMEKAEKRASETGKVIADEDATEALTREVVIPEGATPKLSSMVVPLIVLVVFIFGGLLWTGGFPERGLADAMANAASMKALVTAFAIATVVAAIYTIKDKVYTIKEAIAATTHGFANMMECCCILVLAWSIGDVCDAVGTTAYMVNLTQDFLTPTMLYVVMFIVCSFTAFCTGTSWGTFAIYLTISIPLAYAIGAPIEPAIGLVIAGGIFGDNCSPISDTTVLSSMGSSCNHLAHVRTQLPYAVCVAGASAIAFIEVGLLSDTVGLIPSGLIGMVITILGSWLFAFVAHKAYMKKHYGTVKG